MGRWVKVGSCPHGTGHASGSVPLCSSLFSVPASGSLWPDQVGQTPERSPGQLWSLHAATHPPPARNWWAACPSPRPAPASAPLCPTIPQLWGSAHNDSPALTLRSKSCLGCAQQGPWVLPGSRRVCFAEEQARGIRLPSRPRLLTRKDTPENEGSS